MFSAFFVVVVVEVGWMVGLLLCMEEGEKERGERVLSRKYFAFYNFCCCCCCCGSWSVDQISWMMME